MQPIGEVSSIAGFYTCEPMARPKEIEIKFVAQDLRAMRACLRNLGFKLVTPRTREMNVLYDLPGHPLHSRGELLRLRSYGSKWKLTHKARGTVGRHKSREETETGVENGPHMNRILLSLGFQPSFRYEKFRSEWTDGQGHVVLDETPIGNMGEIEGPARWIDRTAATLGISRQDYITISYAELFFQWKQKTGSKADEMTFAAINAAKGGIRDPPDVQSRRQ
jgi:adenylate cyclase class 2